MTDSGKEILIGAVKSACEVIKSTMGPGGRKVSIPGGFTRDGVTVARQLPSQFTGISRRGVAALVDAADKTVKSAGDGTTTTCVLVEAMLNHFDPALKQWTEEVIQKLIANSIPITKELLRKMAVISANNNEEIGGMIADLIWELGPESLVKSDYAMDGITRTEIKKGYNLNSGLLVPMFLSYRHQNEFVVNNGNVIYLHRPYVVFIEEQVDDYKHLLPILKAYTAIGDGRPLLIVAGDISGGALQLVVKNTVERGVPIFIVKSPYAGNTRYNVMKDLAVATGAAKVMSKYQGNNLSSFKGAHEFGSLELAELSRTDARFMLPDIDISEYVSQVALSGDDDAQERVSKLTKGVGLIHIGGFTEHERKVLSDLVEDCVLACQSAFKYGVSVGGGYAYANIDPCNNEVLLSVAKTIAENVGSVYLHSEGFVFNAHTGGYDLIEATEIFDSTAVLVEALKSATSLVWELQQVKWALAES